MVSSQSTPGPRDVFLYILQVIFLYACVFHFGALLFGFVDIALPDPLYGDAARWARAALRWPLAVLTIVFPLYLWLTIWLQRDAVRNPAKREMRTRKWLLNLTIFLAAIVIIGDLISLLFGFLNGELTFRFILKVIIVLVLAGSVFLYYGWMLRFDETPTSDPRMKLFVRAIVALGAIAVVAGFVIAGSPMRERQLQFDDRRVNDLSMLQSQIVYYWQGKEVLPPNLAALQDDIIGFIPPVDPRTGESYEYRPLGGTAFELCATFELPSEGDSRDIYVAPPVTKPIDGSVTDTWQHDAGRTCFAREIDPELFPPLRG